MPTIKKNRNRKTYVINIAVVEVHRIEVEASTEAEAIDNAYATSIKDIRENGKLISVETDYAEIME